MQFAKLIKPPVLRFSLRTIFVLMTPVAVGLVLVAVPLRRAAQQRKAIGKLQALGATVEYERSPAAWRLTRRHFARLHSVLPGVSIDAS